MGPTRSASANGTPRSPFLVDQAIWMALPSNATAMIPELAGSPVAATAAARGQKLFFRPT